MKTKLIGLAVAGALSFGSANAVTLTTSLIANTANNVGLVTTLQSGSRTTVNGTAYIYSTSTDIVSLDPSLIDTRAEFEALITNNPGVVRSAISIVNGAITSSASTDLGAAGNRLYVWFSSNDGLSYGAYKGIVVPSLGSVVINSASLSDIGVGTSVFTGTAGVSSGANTASGIQLAYAAIPEPSAVLLGALGALGLLRRRRI